MLIVVRMFLLSRIQCRGEIFLFAIVMGVMGMEMEMGSFGWS